MKKKLKIFFAVFFSFLFLSSLPGSIDEAYCSNALSGNSACYKNIDSGDTFFGSGAGTQKDKKKRKRLPFPNPRLIKSKVKRLYKNQKGFWEAELPYGIIMVYIPDVPDGYWIGKYEVTVGQFKEFVKDIGYRTHVERGLAPAIVYVWNEEFEVYQEGHSPDANWKNPSFSQGEKHPVVCVSWHDAMNYCRWLSIKIDKRGRFGFDLPTLYQWEKAARGTDQRRYPWGNTQPNGNLLNFADKNAPFDLYWIDPSTNDGYKYTAPVGSYPQGASPYGIMDMAGNVWEWCFDVMDQKEERYVLSLGDIESTWLSMHSGVARHVRGGGFLSHSSEFDPSKQYEYTSFYRRWELPHKSYFYLGFRLALTTAVL